MGPALCARCAKQPGSGTQESRYLPLPWQDRAAGCLAPSLPQTARGGDPPTPCLDPWPHTLPHGLGCPCFAFGLFFFGLKRLSRHYLPPVAASGEKDESEVRTSRTVQKG